MRKNMIFSAICFAVVFGAVGSAFAALGQGEISMGMFSIPLPGCAPEITISDNKDANGCYTMTIQSKTLQDGVCSSSGISPTTKQVCDGKDGAGGGGCDSRTSVTGPDSSGCYTVTFQKMKIEDEECVEDGEALTYTTCDGATEVVDEMYVPYPSSETYEGGNESGHEGYRRLEIKFKEDQDSKVLKFPDHCEEGEDEDGLRIKKCTAQGGATNWANASGTTPYSEGDAYIIPFESLATDYPRSEYTTPRLSGGNSGYPTAPGVTNKVYKYTSGRERVELIAIDACDWYAKPNDTTDRVKKCTVGAPTGTEGLTNVYAAGTVYCLGNVTATQCDNDYTVPVGAVDTCATLLSSDAAWGTTVDHTESDYTPHVYTSSCTNNCTGTVGFKTTKEVMCSGNVNTSTQYDPCSHARAQSNVTCATGYAYQTCTPVDARASVSSYSGCFPDPLNGLYAHKDEIVPVSLAADDDYLYYCKVSDCSTNASCWVGNNIGGTPLWNNGNGCWGRVSVTGLQGANGESCFVTNDGTNWNMCCSPTYTGGDCSVITDTDIIEKLQGMMCHVNYTHKYLHDDGDGGVVANATKAGAIGERVIVTNSCNSDSENLDAYYGQDGEDGEDGDNYNPCDGLTSAEAQTTVQSQTSVYRSRTYSPNHFSPARGYYEKTINYCEGSATTYEADECTPVSLAAGDSRTVGTLTCNANQTLMRCTPQEGSPITPYFICEDAEVSGYPKKVYVAPTASDGKFTAAGYTKLVHKFTNAGAEVSETQRNIPDECHEVFKRTFTVSGDTTRTSTATTTSALKCTVQDYPNAASPWTVGTTYCLNAASATASTSCDGYGEDITATETSELKYHLPIMDTTNTTTPVAPGWAYREEKSGSAVVRESERMKDDCKQYLSRTISGSVTTTASVWKCTVSAPGNSGAGYAEGREYCLGYTGGTCPASLIDIGAAVDDAAEGDPCAGSTSANAVKKVESRTYSRTTNSQGSMVSTYKMCDGSTHTESTADECKEVPTPAGQTCTNGVWMQCKRQAAEGTNSAGTTYEYCAVYPQCVGNTSSSTIVKKTQRSYTAPTKTGSNSYYDTVGKITDVKIACDGTPISTEESAEDQCDEIPNTASVCPTNKVLKTCTRKGNQGTSNDTKAGTTYNLCTTGPSIYGSIADNDPCGGDTTSDSAKKKVKSIQYEYITKDATGNTAKVGYSKKTTTMCNPAGNTDEYIYDTCVPDVAAAGCNGSSDKNYKCYNQSKLYNSANASEREYNTCNPLSNVSSVALSDKIDGKLDNDVTFTTGTYDNKDYILMSATGITNKPVVPVDDLKPQSLFDTWKEEQKNKNWTTAECTALFGNGVNCATGAGLTTDMMFQSFTDYGVWKQEQVEGGETNANNLTTTVYRQSLQPCQNGFTIVEDSSYTGTDSKYIMSCVD